PHAERDGRDDDVDTFAQERDLVAAALRVGKAGMVRQRRNTDAAQPRRQRVDLAPRRAVDDPRLPAPAVENLQQLTLERAPRQRAVQQVRTIERSDELERIPQRQLGADVPPHARGRRRSERVQADAGQQLPETTELAIFGPEVVAPLADAVGFVHRHEADIAGRQPPDEALAALSHEPFRRDVQQAVPAVAEAGIDAALFVRGERTVEERRRHAVADERIDLIFHQGDQRRDDDGQPGAEHRRGLEAERLAAPGRQYRDRVAAIEDRVHRFALERPERLVPPIARKYVLEL